jgi:hypothetical protein
VILLGIFSSLFSNRVNTFERFTRYFANKKINYGEAKFVEVVVTIEATVAGSIQQYLRSQSNSKAAESCRF